MNIQHKGIKNHDAKLSLRVRVRPQDLKDAVCKDRQRCAIAQSILRQTRADWVDVGTGVVLIKKGRQAMRFVLDSVAQDQVRYFDTHRTFAPCNVVLRPPSISKQLGYRRGERSATKSGGHLKRRKPTR